jgi:predicted component of type VI protein secretion system
LIAEEGALQGREYPIEPGLTLGREAHNQVPMPENRKSSRDHAKVWRESPGKYTVADLGSTNGTLVNDERVSRKPLVDGDEIRLGDQVFRFVLDDAERPAKKEAPSASLADVLSGKAKPTATAGSAAAGAEAATITVKSRVLQYSKKAGGGSLASWDVSQSAGPTRWVLILVALAVAAGLFFLVTRLVGG